MIGWRSTQRATACAPSSLDSTSTPFETVFIPLGRVTRTLTESALSSGWSLHGHHSRAPNGSLSVQTMGSEFFVVKAKTLPKPLRSGVPRYQTVRSSASPVSQARSSVTTSWSTPRLKGTAVPPTSTLSTVIGSPRSSSRLSSGPAVTVARMRALPDRTLVTRSGTRSRS